jgi:hypothetical protein
MAVTITPGYDFTVNEVPTFATVQQMASGLSIQGLTFDNVSATLIGQKTGNTSGGTGSSLPAEAWMWSAPDGTIWIEAIYTDSGVTEKRPTPLWTPYGGWTTSRFKYVRGSGLSVSELGTVATISDSLASPNNPLEVKHYEAGYNISNEAYFFGLYSYETPVTTFSGTHEMLVRGRGFGALNLGGGSTIAKVLPSPGTYGWRWTFGGGSAWLEQRVNHSPASGYRAFFVSHGGQSPYSVSSGANWAREYYGYIHASEMWGP